LTIWIEQRYFTVSHEESARRISYFYFEKIIHFMERHLPKKNFLNLPKFPGSAKDFKDFIAGHLQYPREALELGIEGSVLVEYSINDNGDVVSPRVVKGIGHGCDEEAVRLVMLLKYEKVKNRGVRIKVTTKTRIGFILPKMTINYTVTPKQDPPKKDSGSGSYEYSIDINS
jgi:TonB family protein